MDGCKQNSLCFKKVTPAGRKNYGIPSEVDTLLQTADTLSSDDFEILFLELLKTNKLTDEQLIKIKNSLIGEQRRRNKEKYGKQPSHSSASGHLRTGDPRSFLRSQKVEVHASGSGQPSTADSNPVPSSSSMSLKDNVNEAESQGGDSGQPSTVDPGHCSNPPILGLPVSKAPLIVRSDLAALAEVMALDTEKLITNTHEPVSGDVAVVDLRGRLIFWAFIKHNPQNICRFNEKQTGLNRTKIGMGIELDVVQNILRNILSSKVVTGFAIENDLKSLGFSQTTMPPNVSLVELHEFFKDANGQPIKLSLLTLHFLGVNPQEDVHSSLKDARATAVCYKRMKAMKAVGLSQFQCDMFDKLRKTMGGKNKSTHPWEACHCGLTKKNGGKKKKGSKSRNTGLVNTKLYVIDDPNDSEFEDDW